MEPTEPAAATTDLAKILIPEIIDFDVIKKDICPSIDQLIKRADSTVAKIAAGIKDDETLALAVREAEALRDNGQDLLKKWREKYYVEEAYRPAEERREVFDSRLKPISAHIKTLMGHVSDYNARKEREAKLARERAEAEARRQQEDADKKRREAEEAERRRLQAIEDEKKRVRDAEEAEARRVQAEKDLKERQEREAREAAAAETRRKLQEEEEARLAHAKVAHDEGNGAAKVDTILESATPISPVLGKAEQTKSAEDVRLEQESAVRVAIETAVNEAHDIAISEDARRAAEIESKRLKEESDRAATAAATSAAAAAAAAIIPEKPDSGTTTVIRWKWDLDSDGTEMGDIAAVMAILKAVLEGVVPIEFIGYNRKRPQDFRPSAITEEVTDKKDRFKCPGVKSYPQQDEQLRRRTVGGRR